MEVQRDMGVLVDVVYQVSRWEMNGLSGGHCRSRLAKDECCRMPF